MFVGALLDLGIDFSHLENELKKLDLDEYELKSSRADRSNIMGTKFDVILTHSNETKESPPHQESNHSL